MNGQPDYIYNDVYGFEDDLPSINTRAQALREPEPPPKKAPCFKHDFKAYSTGSRDRKKLVLKCTKCGEKKAR